MENIKQGRRLLQVSIVVSLIGFLDTLYLFYMEITGNFQCLINKGVFQCETVNSSPYAKFLGVHVSLWGLIFYFLVIVLLFSSLIFENDYFLSFFLPIAALCGLGFSIYLTIVEIFIIKLVCEFCLLSAIVSVSLFVLILFAKKKKHSSLFTKLDFWNFLEKK